MDGYSYFLLLGKEVLKKYCIEDEEVSSNETASHRGLGKVSNILTRKNNYRIYMLSFN